MSGNSEFLQELGNRAKDMSESDQDKMSDTGKALKDAAELGYDTTKEGCKESYDSMAQKLAVAKDYLAEKAEDAKKFLSQKVEDMHSD